MATATNMVLTGGDSVTNNINLEPDTLIKTEPPIEHQTTSSTNDATSLPAMVPTMNDLQSRPKKRRRKDTNPNNKHKTKMITGYIIYASEIRREIIKKYPDKDFGDISKLVGIEWKKLPQETKVAFEKRAQEQNNASKMMNEKAEAAMELIKLADTAREMEQFQHQEHHQVPQGQQQSPQQQLLPPPATFPPTFTYSQHQQLQQQYQQQQVAMIMHQQQQQQHHQQQSLPSLNQHHLSCNDNQNADVNNNNQDGAEKNLSQDSRESHGSPPYAHDRTQQQQRPPPSPSLSTPQHQHFGMAAGYSVCAPTVATPPIQNYYYSYSQAPTMYPQFVGQTTSLIMRPNSTATIVNESINQQHQQQTSRPLPTMQQQQPIGNMYTCNGTCCLGSRGPPPYPIASTPNPGIATSYYPQPSSYQPQQALQQTQLPQQPLQLPCPPVHQQLQLRQQQQPQRYQTPPPPPPSAPPVLQYNRNNIIYRKPAIVHLRPKDASTQTDPIKWVEKISNEDPKKPLKFSRKFIEYLNCNPYNSNAVNQIDIEDGHDTSDEHH